MRTKYCGKIKKIHLNKRVKICGWIHKIRNLGQFIFIDLRDYTGIIQVLFELTNEVVFKKASKLKNEFCVQISGIVQERGKKNKNLKIDTGEIEILGENIKIFNSSKSLPLDYQNDNNNDDLKLKYRYLDLRRFDILENLKLRSQVKYLIKKFMTKKGFLDIETPILTKSTPEGARDYLVPSRNYFGKFYALPQSPQLFKQLLMIAGIDKYYQIVKCFRDEDLRSDRQPEFTQIDIEMSFVNSRQVQNLTEKLIKKIWLKTLGFRLNSFPKISFNRSMKKYGTDKPDLRNPIEIVDVFDFFKEKKYFSFFNLNVKEKNRIALICICKNLNQKRINYYIQYIKKNYSGQLYYIKIKNSCFGCEQTSSSIKKILNEEILKKIIKKSQAKNGSILFLMADIESIVNKSLGMLRLKIGKDLNITIENSWKPVWITNFPMFNKNINGSFSPLHHPFTAVKKNNIKKLKNSPESAISDSYDLVINGYEVGGGSVRINNACMQKKIFDIIGIKDSIQKEKFAFFLEALEYGAPPHAGIALGLDRIIMILTYSKNIREVIAFPKTTSASCLMTDSPSILDDISLKDLGIKIIKK